MNVEVFTPSTLPQIDVFPPSGLGFVEVFVSRGLQGPPGTGNITVAEVPSGAINSSNQNFTTANPFTSIWVYLNGLRMKPTTDFTITGSNSFHFAYPPTTGDILIVDYAS